MIKFKVLSAHHLQRLDVVITDRSQTTEHPLSRSQVRTLIEQKLVTINSHIAHKAGQLVETNQEIIVIIPAVKKLDLTPQKVNIKILYEDQDLAVLEKPHGLSVHPSATENEPTVVHGLLYELKNLSNIGGVERPGIVHRIDKGTSGILVISKNNKTHYDLAQQFKEHSITRKYQALVFGNLSVKGQQGRIETFFDRHPKDRKKMTGTVTSGRKAITHWKILESFSRFSLIECTLETGRTHQIRVHMAEAGYSVVGDPLYGGNARKTNDCREQYPQTFLHLERLTHQLLHAYYLEFVHPTSRIKIKFESPLPQDFQTVLDSIRAESQTI